MVQPVSMVLASWKCRVSDVCLLNPFAITAQNQYVKVQSSRPLVKLKAKSFTRKIRGGGGGGGGGCIQEQAGWEAFAGFVCCNLMSARKPFIGGNWKCNLNTASIQGKRYQPPSSSPSSSTSVPTLSVQRSCPPIKQPPTRHLSALLPSNPPPVPTSTWLSRRPLPTSRS